MSRPHGDGAQSPGRGEIGRTRSVLFHCSFRRLNPTPPPPVHYLVTKNLEVGTRFGWEGSVTLRDRFINTRFGWRFSCSCAPTNSTMPTLVVIAGASVLNQLLQMGMSLSVKRPRCPAFRKARSQFPPGRARHGPVTSAPGKSLPG